MRMRRYAIEIKWALIFTAVSILWMVFEKLMGWHGPRIEQHAMLTNLFAIPATAMCVLTLLEKRKKYYNGVMSWKQGFFTGLRMTLIVVALSPVAQIITTNVISPEYFPNVIAYAVSSGYMTQEEAEAFFGLRNYIVQSMIGGLVIGTATSAVVAIFTRKKS